MTYIVNFRLLIIRASLNNLNVAAGLYSQSSPGEFEQVRSVSVFVIHPQYTSPTYENDIAIIKVSAPFQLNEQVASIPLVESGTSIPAGTLSTVIGWGSSTVISFTNFKMTMNLQLKCFILKERWIGLGPST